MAWIESHQTLWRHPKTQKAARLAGVSLHEMIGLLHCFWWWSLDYAEDGNLDAFDPADVESAVGWTGETGALWEAWTQAGFIDVFADDASTIHDWDQYIGRLLEKRELSRQRAQTSRERARTVRAANKNAARTETHGARSVRPYNQPNQPTNQPRAAKPESGEKRGEDGDDYSLVKVAHGRLVSKTISMEQAKTYETWLAITTPAAIISALELAAANATKQNGRFKYAMAVLEGQREDRTLPLRPREMQVIDIPPEVLQPLSWM